MSEKFYYYKVNNYLINILFVYHINLYKYYTLEIIINLFTILLKNWNLTSKNNFCQINLEIFI